MICSARASRPARAAQEEPAETRVLREGLEAPPERPVLGLAHGEVQAEIDEGRLLARRHPEVERLRLFPPHERPPPHFSFDETAPPGLRVGATDCSDGDPQGVRQIAVRRKT